MAAITGDSKPDIILNSPVGSKPAVYKWPLTYKTKGQKIDGSEEIIETIRWVAREYPEFKPAIENLLTDQLNSKSYECIKNLCDKYNKITDYVMRMNKGTSIALKTSSRASQGLLRHIIQQVYNFAVVEPNELNKYSPFSSETYGETSFEFMAQLIDKNQFKPPENGIFIDLGSGVGHLVLQMAATVDCEKCYGIEIADVPAGYAKLMEERFKFWMEWHGKTYTEFELIQGDFLDEQYREIIKSSTHILVNNFAFKPEVDYNLKNIFDVMKDGTQILSSKPFCAPKIRLNSRMTNDVSASMHVIEIEPEQKKDTVSWTPKPLPYYLHVLDRAKLQRFLERQHRRKAKETQEGSNKRAKINSDESENSDDNEVTGPTTRRAWKRWCVASSMHASNRTSTDSTKTASSRNNSTDTENLYDGAIDEEKTNITNAPKETDSQKREKKPESQSTTTTVSTSQDTAQTKSGQNSSQAPKSCLDKKRDYAIKKSGSGLLQNAPSSALYSISKPADSANGSSSTSKIPNIVIKVKPSIEPKVVNDTPTPTTEKTSIENPKQTARAIDENGKKLRQRKKSIIAQPEKHSLSPAKSTSKSEPKSANSVLNSATNGTRAKKAAQIPKTTGKATNSTKKKVASPDKNLSLDLLHAKTVESVSGTTGFYPQPGAGCEDHNLGNITDTPSLPKVVIKDVSMYVSAFLGPKTIEKFTSCMRQEFEVFAKKIQRPHAKDALLKSIEMERMKNRELHKMEEDLTKNIKFLNDRIPRAMKVHCDELGIKNNHKSIVSHLGALLKKHQDLSAYQAQLDAALLPNQRTMNPPAAHSNSNQSLCSPYRVPASSATLDLSLKQGA